MQKSRQFTSYLLSLITVVILVAWITSYNTIHRIYSSRWHEAGTIYSEKMHWLGIDNGYVVIQRRLDGTPKEFNQLPESRLTYDTFPAEGNGFYRNSEIQIYGNLRFNWFKHIHVNTANHILLIPFWFLLIPLLLTAALIHPRSKQHP